MANDPGAIGEGSRRPPGSGQNVYKATWERDGIQWDQVGRNQGFTTW